MLRLVPNELREASFALGVPKWLDDHPGRAAHRRSPASRTGVMIAIARVIGETAPLLITVGVTDSINRNLFEGNMMTLPGLRLPAVRGRASCPARPATTTCIPTINYDRAWARHSC